VRFIQYSLRLLSLYGSFRKMKLLFGVLYHRCPVLTPRALQLTGIAVTPCTTLPKSGLSPGQAGIGVRALHNAGRAATTRKFLLSLAMWRARSVVKLARTASTIIAAGFKLSSERGMGMGKGLSLRSDDLPKYRILKSHKRLYQLTFIYKYTRD
jgi:hypothetical protein